MSIVGEFYSLPQDTLNIIWDFASLKSLICLSQTCTGLRSVVHTKPVHLDIQFDGSKVEKFQLGCLRSKDVNVVSLVVRNYSDKHDFDLAEHILMQKNLSSLCIMQEYYSNSHAGAFYKDVVDRSFSKLTQLQIKNLSYFPDFIQNFKIFQNMKFLEISECKDYFFNVFKNLHVACPNLTHLDLRWSPVTEDVVYSDDSPRFFGFFDSQFSSDDITLLVKDVVLNLPKLEFLDLQDHGLGKSSVLEEAYCNLILNHRSLKTLVLSSIQLENVSPILTSLQQNNSLTYVDLKHCEITKDQLESIDDLRKSKNIKIITKLPYPRPTNKAARDDEH